MTAAESHSVICNKQGELFTPPHFVLVLNYVR